MSKPKVAPFTDAHKRRIIAACVCDMNQPHWLRCHGKMVRCQPAANVVMEIAYERGVYTREKAS
jgi:hypothetical protein